MNERRMSVTAFYKCVSVITIVFMFLSLIRLAKPKKDVSDHAEQCLYIYLYIVCRAIELTGEFGNMWLKAVDIFICTIWLCLEAFALGAISNEERNNCKRLDDGEE